MSLWILYVDGSSNAGGIGAALILSSPSGIMAEHTLLFNFKTSNNEIEHEALLPGLRLIQDLEVQHLQVLSDSQLMVSHVRRKYEAKASFMRKYLQKVQEITPSFNKFEIL